MTFATRAARCQELARGGGPLAQYFEFLRDLSEVQEEILQSQPARSADDSVAQSLAAFAARLGGRISREIDTALERLVAAAPLQREEWARAVMAGENGAVPAGVLPFVGAALQVHWQTCRAGEQSAVHENAARCPLCGAAPIAGVIRSRGGVEGLRYLQCGICGSEWKYMRLTCTYCGTSKDLSYFAKAGDDRLRAEACAACAGYLKIWYRPPSDVVTDDIASIDLDVLMGNAGIRRMTFNPLFAFA